MWMLALERAKSSAGARGRRGSACALGEGGRLSETRLAASAPTLMSLGYRRSHRQAGGSSIIGFPRRSLACAVGLDTVAWLDYTKVVGVAAESLM